MAFKFLIALCCSIPLVWAKPNALDLRGAGITQRDFRFLVAELRQKETNADFVRFVNFSGTPERLLYLKLLKLDEPVLGAGIKSVKMPPEKLKSEIKKELLKYPYLKYKEKEIVSFAKGKDPHQAVSVYRKQLIHKLVNRIKYGR